MFDCITKEVWIGWRCTGRDCIHGTYSSSVVRPDTSHHNTVVWKHGATFLPSWSCQTYRLKLHIQTLYHHFKYSFYINFFLRLRHFGINENKKLYRQYCKYAIWLCISLNQLQGFFPVFWEDDTCPWKWEFQQWFVNN